MKYFENLLRFTGIFVVFCAMLLAMGASAFAQNYSKRIFDIRSPLSQDILNVLIQQVPKLQTPDFERIAEDVQAASDDCSSKDCPIEVGLILGIMSVEDSYAGTAQARLYYFNLDMGSLANSATFPIPWFDAERVARGYKAEFDRYGDRQKAIAAYFVGYQALPANFQVAGLPQGLRDMVTKVMNFSAQWSHLGERNAPQVVETTPQTPKTVVREQPQPTYYDRSDIEQRYIQNMMHFNPKLDEDTAHQIFQAIEDNAGQYPKVDARLVMALVACESSFQPHDVSWCGASGLGELMPGTAQNLGVDDVFDVSQNIAGVFEYLQVQLDKWSSYNYPLDRVLAAYNAGPGEVAEYTDPPYDGIPPYDETINYVRRVVNIYFYLLPEDERSERLSGQSRHITEDNGTISLAP